MSHSCMCGHKAMTNMQKHYVKTLPPKRVGEFVELAEGYRATANTERLVRCIHAQPTPLPAHRVISLRCRIWSLSEHGGHRSSRTNQPQSYEYAPWLGGTPPPSVVSLVHIPRSGGAN